jgi:hypothetical protein
MNPRRAYRMVRTAVKNGALVRPDGCSRCGRVPGPASDGRSQIHAHHEDYSRPLDVVWLCAACHREETPLPEVVGASVYGERNGFSRLTEAQVAEIKQSPLGCRRLALIYSVHKTTIQCIRRGQTWKGIAASPVSIKENGNEE